MIPDAPDASPAASDQGSALGVLHGRLQAALDAGDGGRARRIVAEAAATGASPGRIYGELIRRTLAAQGSLLRRDRLSRAEGLLSELRDALPSGPRPSAGRTAVLVGQPGGLESLDGRAAATFLEVDGWIVEHVHLPTGELPMPLPAGSGTAELVVALATGPRQALRLAPACTGLRRLPDPPVILLGDFSGGSRHLAAASALGADAVVHDPEELARCAAARLPAEGRRRWGVRLMRSNGTLRLSPTGNLDAISVARLSDVALTRAGTYTRLVLDLSDLAAVDSGGVDGLGGWPALRELDDVQLLLLAGARVRPWLVESDLGRWTLVDEVAA